MLSMSRKLSRDYALICGRPLWLSARQFSCTFASPCRAAASSGSRERCELPLSLDSQRRCHMVYRATARSNRGCRQRVSGRQQSKFTHERRRRLMFGPLSRRVAALFVTPAHRTSATTGPAKARTSVRGRQARSRWRFAQVLIMRDRHNRMPKQIPRAAEIDVHNFHVAPALFYSAHRTSATRPASPSVRGRQVIALGFST